MLRCNNATAFATQLTTNMALRAPLRSPWITRASQRLLLPFARGSAMGRIGTEKIATAMSRRSYSKDSAFAEEHDRSTTTRVPSRPSSRGKERPPGFWNDNILMQVALGKGPWVSRKAVEMELVWLKNRVILAERIQRLLRQDDIVLAAEIVRAAQRANYDTPAAWNCILDYCLAKGNARAAFKFWNDMKKRGSMPNDHAYTTMLHGLSKVEKTPHLDPIIMARSIYRSLINPDTPTKLSLIHTNAMLTVCGRHGAMDVLWEVAGGLPEEGPGSPDTVTYTIILNAIRRSVQRDVEKFKESEVEKPYYKRLSGIAEGKRVWSDVVYRWKKGQIAMSNQLVSSMAGLLWEGTGDRHLYEVLKLLRQTTGIPILAEEPSRNYPTVSTRAYSRVDTLKRTETTEIVGPAETDDVVPFVDEKGKKVTAPGSRYGPEHFEELEKEEENFDQIFDPVVSADEKPYTGADASSSPGPHYIPVGNRELSVIMETCLQMTYAVQAAKAYWSHLTQEDHGYLIVPDRRSFLGYLRILRLAHSSRLTVQVVRDQMIPAGLEQGLPFHIALSTCRRDRRNQNVLKHANELLKLMGEALLLPDYRAVGGYLDLITILQDNPQHLVSLNDLNVDTESLSTNLETLGGTLVLDLQKVAVKNLLPVVAKLDECMTEALKGRADLSGRHGVEPKIIRMQDQPGSQVLTVLTRVRMLIDSILKPVNESLLSKEDRKQFEKDSIALRKYSDVNVINRYKNKTVFATVNQQKIYYKRMMARREKLAVK